MERKYERKFQKAPQKLIKKPFQNHLKMFNIYEKAPKNSKNCMKFFKISKELSNLLEKYMKKWVKVHRI